MLARHAPAGKLVGDTLLAAAFVSYAGPFTLPFRKRLVEEQWAPDLVARNIPLSEGFHPLGMLASDASKVLPAMPQHTRAVYTHCIVPMDKVMMLRSHPVRWQHNDPSSNAQALWATEGLQTDTLSVENGAIVSAAARYPLLIDPQLQGLRWIMNRESAAGLVIIQQSQPKYVDQVRSTDKARSLRRYQGNCRDTAHKNTGIYLPCHQTSG